VGTGAGGTADAVVAANVAATTAATSCRDPVATAAPCGGSLAAAALSVTRGALDERRLMGTDASDLSALAGARAGTVDATLRTRRQKIELQPLKTRTSGEPYFLFLEGSTGAAVAAAVATAALPDASVTHTSASTARVASSTDRLVAGAPVLATGACSFAASTTLGEGVGDSTSQGGLPLVALLLFLPSR
jgi:hypothetical protein